MSNCTKNNPCSCLGTINTGPTSLCGGCPPGSSGPCPSKCKNPGTCLELCSPIIHDDDPTTPGPCGQYGTVDLTTFKHETDVCGDNPLKFSYVSHDEDIFVSASVTEAGILTWSTGGPETCGKYGEIMFKACCGKFSTFQCITIGVADLCSCQVCDKCEQCDPCTGLCVEKPGEIKVSQSEGGKISLK